MNLKTKVKQKLRTTEVVDLRRLVRFSFISPCCLGVSSFLQRELHKEVENQQQLLEHHSNRLGQRWNKITQHPRQAFSPFCYLWISLSEMFSARANLCRLYPLVLLQRLLLLPYVCKLSGFIVGGKEFSKANVLVQSPPENNNEIKTNDESKTEK